MRPRRVQVRGNSGSGKTTVAAELARRLGVPHIELDALHWDPGWTQTHADTFRARVREAIAAPAWVADGNYDGKLGTLVPDAADLVLWLDVPLRTCLARATRRALARIRSGDELWNGNRQTWRAAFWGRDSLLLWTIRMHRAHRRTIQTTVAPGKLVRIRSRRELDAWLARVA